MAEEVRTQGAFDECAGGILSGSGDRVDAERRVPLHRAVAGLAVSAPSGDRRLTAEGAGWGAAREAARRGSSAAPIPQPRKRRACPPGTVRTANAKTSVLSQKLAIIDSP